LGQSLGGWIAAKYAAHCPDRVTRLALLAPAGFVPARTSAIIKTVWYSMQAKNGSKKIKRMIFGKGEIPPYVSLFFDLVQQHYAPRFGSPPLLTDYELNIIKAPVMMILGGNDVFFDAKKAYAKVKKHMQKTEVIMNTNDQHGMMDFEGCIATFLAGK
jgi:pimeloyl-ACP methyl ester carboxylesterase